MMPAGFHIEIEESFYVLFEARRHPVMPRQVGVPLKLAQMEMEDLQV